MYVFPGEYIALYQSQRAIMKQKHQEKEQYISMLAQDKEEMKVLQCSCKRCFYGCMFLLSFLFYQPLEPVETKGMMDVMLF